jgi:hypothetical protein
VKFGIDIFPPIQISEEQTRLSMFYERAHEKKRDLFAGLNLTDREFKISGEFGGLDRPGAAPMKGETFMLTRRGPVFIFPLLLPEPVGETGLEDGLMELFKQVYSLFSEALPARKAMRIGLVRELVFRTGNDPCFELLTDRPQFGGADLVGGQNLLAFRDERCNVQLKLQTGELKKQTSLPVGGVVIEDAGRMIHAHLDVNNHEVRVLQEPDIDDVMERADSLWPAEMLEFLNRGISK